MPTDERAPLSEAQCNCPMLPAHPVSAHERAPLTDAEIGEMEKRHSFTTKGKWGYDLNRTIAVIEDGEWGESVLHTSPATSLIGPLTQQDKANAEFAARTHQDIPRLIHDLRAAREALRNLVAKLDEINTDEQFKSVFVIAAAHGFTYRGANWVEALAAARQRIEEERNG